MNIKNLFKVSRHDSFGNTALLILRLVTGVAMVIHGWGKIQAPFSWIPLGSGMNVPGIFQFLAAFSEFGGGIAWIIGFLVPLSSLGIAFTMLIATCVHAFVFKDPFVHSAGGSSYELALTYLLIAILLIAIGPGKYSLDKVIFGKKN